MYEYVLCTVDPAGDNCAALATHLSVQTSATPPSTAVVVPVGVWTLYGVPTSGKSGDSLH